LRILIDADACPVTDIALKTASKFNIPCILLCDTAHIIHRPSAETITVAKGADSVDFRLVNLINKDDIAITQDYGLAAMCLAKGAAVIHQDGIIYTNENIDAMLHCRYLSKKARTSGIRLKGPRKRTARQDQNFETALTKLLESLL